MTTPHEPQDSHRPSYTNAPRPVAAPVYPVRVTRTRQWWLPLAIGLGALIAAVLFFAMRDDCGVVDASAFPTDSARTAAFERGDTLRADDARQGTAAAARACGKR